MPEDDDERKDRAAILARRAKFVAVALASFAAVGCGDDGAPRPCLNVAEPVEGPSEGELGPQSCLAAPLQDEEREQTEPEDEDEPESEPTDEDG